VLTHPARNAAATIIQSPRIFHLSITHDMSIVC
jgi:hypothetical protein